MPVEVNQRQRVNAAFGKQSIHFDDDDSSNAVLQQWRQQIYAHIDHFIKPNSKILELNAGTGIDAVRFAQNGHTVLATDLSDGMVAELKDKVVQFSLTNKVTVQQVSFEELKKVEGKFDYVFSNFGGLNCTDDLTKVTGQLTKLLAKDALVTWVIMPRFCPWELAWIVKGEFGKAFRRLKKNGTMAHLEGEFFMTYYYSLNEIEKAFGHQFRLIQSEGLGIFSPPPAAMNFLKRFPRLSRFLYHLDKSINRLFPFNHCGDHIIVTFQLK